MKKINFKNDIVFKEVFASEDDVSKTALKDLLSAYLKKDIVNVQIMKNEIRSSFFLQKETRMDINVIFNDGEMANIEMQLLNQKDRLNNRIVYYLAQLFLSQPMKGKSYDDLHNTYSILIANFTLLNDEFEYHDFHLQDERKLQFSNLLHVIVIELNKVKEKNVETMDAIEGWNYFFRNYENEEKQSIIELIKKKWSGVAMAERKISQISQEQIDRINQIYDDLWNMEEQWRFDKAMEEKYETGKLEGKAEGLEQGIDVGKAELIQQMLLKLSVEEVANILNMEVADIKKMI